MFDEANQQVFQSCELRSIDYNFFLDMISKVSNQYQACVLQLIVYFDPQVISHTLHLKKRKLNIIYLMLHKSKFQ